MEKSIGQPKRVKTKSGRAGSFFLGWLVGFLVTIALLAGIVCFAYFHLSVAWLNKYFKVGINPPFDENLTISRVVDYSRGLLKNYESYTLKDLEKDFGIKIKDKYYNINISQLKNINFSKLADEITKRFGNISAYELEGILTLPDNIKNILSDTTTYYVSNGKLCKDTSNTEVDFNYKIENNKLILQNLETVEKQIAEDNTVKIELKYLPLKIAFANITDSISSDITVGQLRDTYHLDLPSYLADNVKVSEIEKAIQDLQIGTILGIDTNSASGLMAKIATAKVSELNQDFIESLTVKDIFPEMYEEGGDKGILGLIPETTQLPNIPSAIESKVKEATIQTLIDNKLFEEPEGYTEIKDKWIDVNLSKAETEGLAHVANYKQFSTLTINEINQISFYIIQLNADRFLQSTKPAT